MAGSYRAPLDSVPTAPLKPPQRIISLPVHSIVCRVRAIGTVAPLEVGIQESVSGAYRAPMLLKPPQTIISVPVHTAVW